MSGEDRRRVVAVVPMRNEERFLGDVLGSLRRQTLPLTQIIVVDDGSVDTSGKIAEGFGCLVVRLPFHRESFVGRPELAVRFNVGLKLVGEDADFCLILGGDTVLSSDYVERVVERMERYGLVVSGGRISGEYFNELQVRGTGRIVDMRFWRSVNGGFYPVCYGFEGWLTFKAMQLGFQFRCFRDIVFWSLRPTGRKRKEHECWGKAMYVLGYNWKTGLKRCVFMLLKNPLYALFLFRGWVCHGGLQRSDIAEWVNKMQSKRFWFLLLKKFRR